MKKNEGITLISLIVYIIVLLIAISIITMITTSMTQNLGEIERTSRSVSKINKFDMYFLSDIKNEGVSIYDVNENHIILEDKNSNMIQYIYQNNVIYRIEGDSGPQIQICNNISNFTITRDEENTDVINIMINTEDYSSQKSYKIGKW